MARRERVHDRPHIGRTIGSITPRLGGITRAQVAMRVRPLRDRKQRIGPQPVAPELAELLRTLEAELIIQGASSEFWPHIGKLAELRADMRLQDLLHRMRLDAELGRHQGRDPRRPVDPGVAFLAR